MAQSKEVISEAMLRAIIYKWRKLETVVNLHKSSPKLTPRVDR